MVNITVMGCSCVMTSNPFGSFARTMFPGIDEAEADAPADGGGDAGVGELQLGVVDLTLVCLDDPFGLAH